MPNVKLQSNPESVIHSVIAFIALSTQNKRPYVRHDGKKENVKPILTKDPRKAFRPECLSYHESNAQGRENQCISQPQAQAPKR